MTRTPEALMAAVAGLEVETAEKYRKRDVTGDGIPETFCNVFVHDVTSALGCPVPLLLANAQIDWLNSQDFWTPSTVLEAEWAAGKGEPVVAGWKARSSHGHIALGVPAKYGESGLWIAQAGATNFSCGRFEWGFGHLPAQFWRHA